MTLEELLTYEIARKAKNPYFRQKIDVWREYTLMVINDEVTDIDPDTYVNLKNNVIDYISIFIKSKTDIFELVLKKLQKLENIFMIKTECLIPLQSDD